MSLHFTGIRCIWEEFRSLIASLEQNIIVAQPVDDDISAILTISIQKRFISCSASKSYFLCGRDAQPYSPQELYQILVHSLKVQQLIAWQKALERRNQDPEAAITMARTLIESVCKHILDQAGISHSDKDDLPKLYKETAKQLNLAPEQHQEEVFKQIIGGCQTVIQGLGTLRNKLSDAHGKGKKTIKPSPRHAALAVNLAGLMAAFLVATWEERLSKAT